MTQTITSDLVEAYSLCPRKAFLLMAGTGANPGPHDYELALYGYDVAVAYSGHDGVQVAEQY
jgi:hypothetical protein